MKRDGTHDASPLADFLRRRVEQIVDRFQAATPGSSSKRGLDRFLRALDELTAAADALSSPARETASDRETATILVAAADAFADQVRQGLGAGFRIVKTEAAEESVREGLEQRPALLLAASGSDARELIRAVHALQPGIPAIVAAQDAEVPGLLQTFAEDPVIVLRSPGSSELTMTIQAIAGLARGVRPKQPAIGPPGSVPVGLQQIEPRSYAHLAGLLPRALERSVSFDVGAAVIARPGMEPLVDVHATSDCPEQTRELVRERALSLYKVIAGGVRDEQQGIAPLPENFPLRSSIYFPLASEGGVVGLTYLASFRAGAFSQEDERVLAALASHASGAYRRLESSVHRLRLSPRQSQVLALIASGLSDKEVASRLGLAHRTVRTHVDRMLREHGLRSRTEAVAAWLRGQQG
jgi:DNA-binding CsgD family transcriptional regulator